MSTLRIMLAVGVALATEYWSGWTIHWMIALAIVVGTYFLTARNNDKAYVVTDLETGKTRVVESTPKKMGWEE